MSFSFLFQQSFTNIGVRKMFRNLEKRLWQAAAGAELESRGNPDFDSRAGTPPCGHAYLSGYKCHPVGQGLFAGRRRPPGKGKENQWAWPRRPPTPGQ